MPLFLTLSEGGRADRARPILAVADQRIIAGVLRAIGQLGDDRDADTATVAPLMRPLPIANQRGEVRR